MLQAAIHTVFQHWSHTLYEHCIPAEGLYTARPVYVPAMHNLTDGALRKFLVHSALNEYVRLSGNYRQDGTAQLFITYGGRIKGKPISKQGLSNWLVQCIKFAYEKHDLPVPGGVKDHQTHKMAVTMLTWLVPTPKLDVRLLPGETPIGSPGSTSLMPWLTPMQILGAEF